ncbi:MAG: uncharacterized membrane protein YebE (DUF533 family) [Bacteroidia bacterium]|jgi:uncharacterized membrane protein YebE (DUF533 family)
MKGRKNLNFTKSPKMNNPTIVMESAFATTQFAAKLAETGAMRLPVIRTNNDDLLRTIVLIMLALAILGAIGYEVYQHFESQKEEQLGTHPA